MFAFILTFVYGGITVHERSFHPIRLGRHHPGARLEQADTNVDSDISSVARPVCLSYWLSSCKHSFDMGQILQRMWYGTAGDEDEYDVVFAGGGTSACVVAGRLAAADPTLRILVIEAGSSTQGDLAHIQPARYAGHLLPDSKTVKFFTANPSEALGGRSVVVPTGQCIGGGSSVNCEYLLRLVSSGF